MPKAQDANLKTRRGILNYLKQHGPTDALVLAKFFKISPMAVRQHLYELKESDLVSYEEIPGPVGRPAKNWCLTSSADKFFHDGHSELTVSLIELLRNTLGEKALDQVIAARAEQQKEVYQTRIPKESSLASRIKELAQIRSEEGYMAEVKMQKDGSYLLAENHCPICSAAKTCTGLCGAELDVFKSVFGKKVSVERTEHILAGARRCAYQIRPKTN